jgi:predicted secreted protein
MTFSLGIFTYLVSWCITLFFILPFRLPVKRALIFNTLLAAIVTLAIYFMIKSELVPLHDVY